MSEAVPAALGETLTAGQVRPELVDTGRSYLLVFSGGTSSIFPIGPDSETVIGRVDEAHLRLHDASVSRVHAKLTTSATETRIMDMGSHNGTRVNGERVSSARVLASGDVVTLGAVTMVFHRESRLPARRPILSEAQLRLRLEEEIERSLRYQRPVTLLSVQLGTANVDRAQIAQIITSQLRLMDAASWDGEENLLVLLPEMVGESADAPAGRLLKALSPLVPEARVGFSNCSHDGCDVDTLLAAARAAAKAASAGKIAPAAEAAANIQVTDQVIIVADPAMTRLFALIERLAVSEIPLLICGETGVGKEIAARAVHHWSPRRDKPLLTINCAALQETLVESELFGFEKGAFSGADTAKPGLFEKASGSTLFLDEVGELSSAAQAKLLRAVETRRITRLGSLVEREIDVRLVAATNRSLEEDVATGRFRQDLFYRLSAATVNIPPLRDRNHDLPILARRFLNEACARLNRPGMEISAGAMLPLSRHPWPGNVRELRNLMDYVAATVTEPVLEPWMLPEKITGSPQAFAASTEPLQEGDQPQPARFRNIYDEIRDLERGRMQAALDAAQGVQVRAAELIGMPLRTFVSKLRQYEIISNRPRPGRKA